MEIADYEKELREIKAEQDKLSAREKEIKAFIKTHCDKEHTTKYGGISVQIVPEYYTLEFDVDAFRQKHTALYEEFLTQKLHEQQTKIVLCKIKGDK